MLRKTLTILSLTGLLLSVGLWGMGSFYALGYISGSYIVFVEDCSVFIAAFQRGSLPAEHFGLHCSERRTAWFVLKMPQYFKPAGAVWGLKLPLWIPTVAFTIGPIYFLPLHRRRKRKKLGLCVKCGYDLRGSKDRCPECGEEFEKQ